MTELFLLAELFTDLRLALAVVFFIFILNWAKTAVGSNKLALVLASVISYLTIVKHPDLIWAGLIVLLAGNGVLNALLKK